MDLDDVQPPAARLPQRPPSPAPRPRAQSEPFQVPAQFTVGYVYSVDMLLHVSLHGHPEQPGRIAKIFDALKGANLISKMKQIPIRPVFRNEALLVHTEEHWDKVLAIQCEHSLLLLVRTLTTPSLQRCPPKTSPTRKATTNPCPSTS